DTPLVLALCDGLGEIAASVPVTLRHRSTQAAGDVSAPTLARELAIEVWTRAGQRRRQMLAPAGARLPGKFTCQCRTTDQCGRIVVPLWEENRMLRQIVVDELDPRLPVGCPVEVELQVEPDRAMMLRVLVRQAGRGEVVQLPAPPAPRRPTDSEVEHVVRRIERLLPEFGGQYQAQLREQLTATTD